MKNFLSKLCNIKGKDSRKLYRRKLVIVGDERIGKTSLLKSYSEDIFPETYVETVFDTSLAFIAFKSKMVEMALWDTAGQEDYDRLRPLAYGGTHVVLLGYSLDNPTSLENVAKKWYQELKYFIPDVPIILVGLKKDLRSDRTEVSKLAAANRKPVTYKEGLEMAQQINAEAFFECSAKTREGVSEVFEKAAQISLKKHKKRHGIKKLSVAT